MFWFFYIVKAVINVWERVVISYEFTDVDVVIDIYSWRHVETDTHSYTYKYIYIIKADCSYCSAVIHIGCTYIYMFMYIIHIFMKACADRYIHRSPSIVIFIFNRKFHLFFKEAATSGTSMVAAIAYINMFKSS